MSDLTTTLWILRLRASGVYELWQEGSLIAEADWLEAFNSALDGVQRQQNLIISSGSGASTSLTAQALSGQKVLTVADSTDFAVGEPIYLGTGVGTAEAHIIASITGPTNITTTANLASTFATGTAVSRSPVEVVDARGTAATLGQRLARLTGGLNVRDYGAIGDGVTIDRAAIQSAIDAANALYVSTGSRQGVLIPNGTFLMDAVTYYLDDNVTPFGSTSLKLLDGVDLYGPGTIKVQNNAYGGGAFYRAISSKEGGLTNGSISDITIDGNEANQTGSVQCSNILIEALANVTVDNVKSINANGMGIMVRGKVATYATNIRITGNTVTNANYIGIQASQFDGLVIADNYVATTVNNGIDVYGEDGTTTCHGRNFVIANNTVHNASIGIFLETVRDGITHGNAVVDCPIGLSVNRINGEPHGLIIIGNSFDSCAVGASLTGDMNGVRFTKNSVRRFTTTGVALGGVGGNISYVTVDDNELFPTGATTYLVTIAGVQAAYCQVRDNTTGALSSRSYDLSNTAGTSVGLLLEPPYRLGGTSDRDPLIGAAGIATASGGTTVITLPASTSGILTIKSTAGGGRHSVYVGAVAVSTTATAITQLGTTFVGAGNNIASVAGAGAALTITVTHAASGSAGLLSWSYRYLNE